MSHAREALIYRRISDDREGRELGIVRQEQDCRELCHPLGWPVTTVYTDNDIGASTKSKKRRPDYEDMLSTVAGGRHGQYVIVAYSNSRLTRRPMELEGLITLHEQTGVQIHTVKSGTDDLSTADGRMVARIKASVDAAEAERTGERVKRAADQRREAGKLHGGPLIFGYKRGEGYRYCQTIDEAEAAAIRKGIRMILEGGAGVMDVARAWDADGFLTATGKRWLLPNSVSKLLTSPRIAGLTAHKGEITGVGNWPAIIDKATLDAVRVALAPKTETPRVLPRKYLLPGVVYCVCGSPMVAQVKVAAGETGRYLCVTQRGGCGKVVRDRKWLEAMVRAYVTGQIEASYAATDEPGTDETDAIERQIDGVNADIGKLMDAHLAGVFTLAEVSGRVIPMRAQIQELRTQQAALVKRARTTSIALDDLLALWNSDDMETLKARKQILKDHVKRIIVKPLEKRILWGLRVPLPPDSIEIVPA